MCISTDRGQHFYYSAFNNLPFDPATVSTPGPRGVTCTDTVFGTRNVVVEGFPGHEDPATHRPAGDVERAHTRLG